MEVNHRLKPITEFKLYKRNLPHYEQPGSIYFITFKTAEGIILTDGAKDVVLSSILFHSDKKYNLEACVVMDTHVHCIIEPLPINNVTQAPIHNVAQAPIHNVAQAPINNVAQAPINNVAQAPINNVAQAPINNVAQAPINNVAQAPINNVAQASSPVSDGIYKSANPYYSIAQIMHSIKSYSAKKILELLNRKGNIWQDENYDRTLRAYEEFEEKLYYIINNPVKAGLVDNPEDYRWLFIKEVVNL